MTILDKLAEHAKERVAEAKKDISSSEICRVAMSMPKGGFEFENALRSDDISFICECKKASPSKGLIAEDFPYLQIAKDYEAAGADCISVLTEPKWFLGRNDYLKEIAANVSIPCLRKDFTVDFPKRSCANISKSVTSSVYRLSLRYTMKRKRSRLSTPAQG